ncbi:hypothetical protein DPX39_030023500 [Trypanosoma brucei equiperdum]|uniref:Uncharacterized protein n=1 Tax=Trypanosoma brucei equiperdum TaxID=630700 RepID=A0A3L6LD39_9TRYP|nr:hypothetical protein DPX39_030023500 [Trypanosoma brucei equiperdum]
MFFFPLSLHFTCMALQRTLDFFFVFFPCWRFWRCCFLFFFDGGGGIIIVIIITIIIYSLLFAFLPVRPIEMLIYLPFDCFHFLFVDDDDDDVFDLFCFVLCPPAPHRQLFTLFRYLFFFAVQVSNNIKKYIRLY